MNYKFRKLLLGLGVGLVIGSMLFYIGRSYYDYRQFRQSAREKIIVWKSIAGEYPNYPDCWAELAVNWHKLGEDKFAQLAIEKASRLDPISDEIASLKKKLSNPKY